MMVMINHERENDQNFCAPEDVEQMPVEGLLLQGERSYGATKYMTLQQSAKWTEICVIMIDGRGENGSNLLGQSISTCAIEE